MYSTRMADWFKDSMMSDEFGIVMLRSVPCNSGFESTFVESE